MKKTATCPQCKENFAIKKLRRLPFAQTSLGLNDYKFYCPFCSSLIKPSLKIDDIANKRMIFYRVLSIVAFVPFYVLSKKGFYDMAFLILLLSQSYVCYALYQISKYKTKNILGDGNLEMEVDC